MRISEASLDVAGMAVVVGAIGPSKPACAGQSISREKKKRIYKEIKKKMKLREGS